MDQFCELVYTCQFIAVADYYIYTALWLPLLKRLFEQTFEPDICCWLLLTSTSGAERLLTIYVQLQFWVHVQVDDGGLDFNIRISNNYITTTINLQ